MCRDFTRGISFEIKTKSELISNYEITYWNRAIKGGECLSNLNKKNSHNIMEVFPMYNILNTIDKQSQLSNQIAQTYTLTKQLSQTFNNALLNRTVKGCSSVVNLLALL